MGQRDENREAKRQAIIDAGLNRLSDGSIGLLRSILNASSLSTDAGLSRDTTYRLFKDGRGTSSDAIVRAVAEGASDPAWSGFVDSSDEIARTFLAAVGRELPMDEAIIEAMAANVEVQFRSPGGPIGWLLQAVAITSSPAWQGKPPADESDRRLGEELLRIRGSFYHRMSGDLLQFMIGTMSMIGRRPRRGMDPAQLLAIMHSMIDGAVLRRFLEPDVFDSRMVGEAVFALAMAFSEDGALSDPRRPDEAGGVAMFDTLTEQAAKSWGQPEERTVDAAASEAGVAEEAARLLFPSEADLADSVVWTRVLGGGSLVDRPEVDRSVGATAATELAMVFGLLRRLRDVVESLPGAMEIVRTERPKVGIGVLAQLEREVADVLRCHCPGVESRTTAGELVGLAATGRPGWPAVTSIMRVLEVRPTEP